MLTDAGFKFLIKAPGASSKVAYIQVGTLREPVVDLNPPKSISTLQNPLNSMTQFNTNSSSTSVLKYHKGVELVFMLNFSKGGAVTRDFYEEGIIGDKGDILFYYLNTNDDKTFLFRKKNLFLLGRHSKNVSITTVEAYKIKAVSFVSKGVLTDYDINYEHTDFDFNPEITIEKPFEVTLRSEVHKPLQTGQLILQSYSLEERKALFHISIPIDSSKNSYYNYLHVKTSFCNLKIYMTEPGRVKATSWPLTNGEDLVIPLEVYLGDA